jgi:CubicO group peptidase (beta-lactamase class C family)
MTHAFGGWSWWHRPLCRCLAVALLCARLGLAIAAEADAPVAVPDEAGLGERLALVAWLHEHRIAVTDPQDLPALRRAYLAATHPAPAPAPATATPDQQRGDLAAALYRTFGVNPPPGASAADIAALIASLEARASAVRDQAAAAAAAQADAQAAAGRRPAAPVRPAADGTPAEQAALRPAALPAAAGDGPGPRSGDERLAAAIAAVHSANQVPALAVAVVRSSGMQAAAVVGWRKRGDPTPALLSDSWHLGSETKAMTAALAALLVEQGKLHWDATLGAVLPQTPKPWQGVTLDQLLMHRAGLPRDAAWGRCANRRAVLEQLAGERPLSPPGTAFSYSNLGYVLAGLMIERVCDASWEDAISAQLWQPLGITAAGFGGMGTPGLVDQPWGHWQDGSLAGNGPAADNLPCMGPAGTVHMPLADWSRFIADQLRGAQGKPGLLRAESYRHLHQPPAGGEYACGWTVARREWAKGLVLTHDGTNRRNYAVVWVAPAIDLAVLACCNQGDAAGVLDAAVQAALALYLP